MSDHTYTYAIHIATTPEKLWEALTSDEFWQQYWGGEWKIESDWKVGSGVKFFARDGSFYSEGEVLEADPPTAVAYTWPLPEAERGEAPPERLVWKIAPSGPGTVKLTLVHDRLTQEWYDGVSSGWPAILSSLKTLLETGKPLALSREGQSVA
jgi:uncharacterized protein YndB with AHSA1/START domain